MDLNNQTVSQLVSIIEPRTTSSGLTTKEVLNETLTSLTPTSFDIIDSKSVQACFCILYTIIFVLGIIGNVLVCYVVVRNKAMQTVTNLFIMNLALSDILLCIFAVPLTPMYTFLGKWIFGKLLCHIMPYVQGCCVYISTLTLTSIAIDRFFVIIYPFHPRMKLRICIMIIIFIWAVSLLVTFPYGIFMALQLTDDTIYCEEDWPSEESRKVFGAVTTTLQFLLPFIIIALCYTCVSIRLNNRAKAKPGTTNSKRDEIDRDRKKRTNRMLISMVAIFGISWLPLNVINIISDFYETTEKWSYHFVSFFFAHSLAMASTCYNPFLYAWLNENFRKEFKQILPCFDASLGARGSIQSGQAPPHRSEKTCNGTNDTQQESLLGSTGASVKMKEPRGTRKKKNEVEIEEIVLEDKPAVAYCVRGDAIKLHLVNEATESTESESSPRSAKI